jgi:hypothetical protein
MSIKEREIMANGSLGVRDPRPGKGKLVWLRARSVGSILRGRAGHRPRDLVDGKWITFKVIHKAVKGRYLVRHSFMLGGRSTYQLQSVALQESGYLNGTGISRILTFKERPMTHDNKHPQGRR